MVYRLRLMGPFELLSPDGQPIHVVAKKSQALLAMLALAAGAPVPRGRLTAVLWGDRGDDQARNSLRQALAGLRKLFPSDLTSPLRITEDSAAIDSKALILDLGEPDGALGPGEFLEGLQIPGQPAQEWLLAERQRLGALRVGELTARIARLEAAGDIAGAVEAAQALVKADPLVESAHRALMRGYAAAGDRPRALKQFKICRDLLRIELGVEPEAETARLAEEIRGGTAPQVTPPSRGAPPSVAVLPFENMSGDPAQQHLSDAITADIITELSRFRGVAVAARHGSAQFVGTGTTIAEFSRALGVDFVVEGSVRETGQWLRIAVELIDTESGNHAWVQRFDRQVGDIHAVLDEVVGAIAAAIEDRVIIAAAAQVRRRPATSWTAHDHLLQGRELCNCHREPESIPYFERAVATDPDFAHAHALLGLACAVSYTFLFEPTLLDRALEAGQRSLLLDPAEATGHWACAMGLTWKRRLDAAGRHFDRAIALNPADLQIRADRANLLRYLGRPEEALAAIENSLRQGPFAPSWFHVARGQALFDLRRYGDAIDALEDLPQKSTLAWAYLIAAHGFDSDPAAISGVLAAARLARPSLDAATIAGAEPYTVNEALDHLCEGLRRAGLEA